MQKQIWASIKESKYYQVSSSGKVKTLARKVPHRIYGFMNEKEYIHGSNLSNRGYLRVNLRLGKKVRTFMVHRLVAEAFIPNLESKPQINHKNGIKTDNRVENLEWVTNQENRDHARENGLLKTRDSLPYSKIKTSDFKDIQELRNKKLLQIEIARKYGVAQQTISKILHHLDCRETGLSNIRIVQP